MRPLKPNDIEAELSYAYLHAVCSHAGIGCSISSRSQDNNGVDALLTSWGPFQTNVIDEERDLKIQLKATSQAATINTTHISYFFKDLDRYNEMRTARRTVPLLLVVLFLPNNSDEWLNHTPDQLALKKCAYWVSLFGAPGTTNTTGVTVYIPLNQEFNVNNIRSIFNRFSSGEVLRYEAPV
jgi:hypothetical protein